MIQIKTTQRPEFFLMTLNTKEKKKKKINLLHEYTFKGSSVLLQGGNPATNCFQEKTILRGQEPLII